MDIKCHFCNNNLSNIKNIFICRSPICMITNRGSKSDCCIEVDNGKIISYSLVIDTDDHAYELDGNSILNYTKLYNIYKKGKIIRNNFSNLIVETKYITLDFDIKNSSNTILNTLLKLSLYD